MARKRRVGSDVVIDYVGAKPKSNSVLEILVLALASSYFPLPLRNHIAYTNTFTTYIIKNT